MLGLRTASMAGGLTLEGVHDVARNISDEELRHRSCYHLIARNAIQKTASFLAAASA